MPHVTESYLPDPSPTSSRLAGVFSLLRTLNLAEINFDLNGSGDSGEASLGTVLDRAGNLVTQIPNIPIGISPSGQVVGLAAFLDDFAAELPEGDWVNNEGGYGTVTISPFAEDPDDLASCDMTYRDEYEDDGDWDGDDDLGAFDIEGEDVGETPVISITIKGEVEP